MTVFALAGVWLDGRHEGVRPLWTVVGAVLGMVVAFTNLYRQVMGDGKRK